ncbi:MAG: hypothetical protein IT537_20385 [Hyphomicrobiales bacterium]|nr:hypothetical protein [Hyphomicrobiales bacterium]
MRWAKLFLYLYVAQAAAGAAIGFTIPFLLSSAERSDMRVGDTGEITGSIIRR